MSGIPTGAVRASGQKYKFWFIARRLVYGPHFLNNFEILLLFCMF